MTAPTLTAAAAAHLSAKYAGRDSNAELRARAADAKAIAEFIAAVKTFSDSANKPLADSRRG